MALYVSKVLPPFQAPPAPSCGDSYCLVQWMSRSCPVCIQSPALTKHDRVTVLSQMESWYVLFCHLCVEFNVVCCRQLSCTKYRINHSFCLLHGIPWCGCSVADLICWLLMSRWFYSILLILQIVSLLTSLYIYLCSYFCEYIWG